MEAILPLNESARLQALHEYEVLDTPPEIAFERLVRLAARLFEVPITQISLVDADRQWLKACFGVDAHETSRELSFCAHAILSHEVTVITDALTDPRFADNPLVTGSPGVRFYAGAPLQTSSGLNLGSFCLVDTVPRQFSEEQQATLAEFAAIVVDELELRRLAREIRDKEAMLREVSQENSRLATAVRTLPSGVVITDPTLPDNAIIFANPGFSAMTGYSYDEVIGKNCRFLQGPETDPSVVQEMGEAIAKSRSFAGILLNYRKDGTPFVNEISIQPVFDGDGRLLNFVGLQNDVTEREQGRALLEGRVRERTEELAQSQIEILARLARAAEFRDDDTGEHTQRVGRTAALLAESLQISRERVELILQAAPLHDVGKIGIADAILLKPGRLTDDELATMQLHAALGAAILSDGRSEIVQLAECIARAHHERWDGTGYPRGLAGVEIPLEGRIVAIADVFDALTHERPYKRAWPVADAVSEIARQSGFQFDPELVRAFLGLPHQDLL